eukprot:scaffold731_cov261-Pinguiococcus_pyrenoidosus.AAC.37
MSTTGRWSSGAFGVYLVSFENAYRSGQRSRSTFADLGTTRDPRPGRERRIPSATGYTEPTPAGPKPKLSKPGQSQPLAAGQRTLSCIILWKVRSPYALAALVGNCPNTSL